ncbi:hypothetical protein [Streptomyces sp. NRRL B-24484]|uniref:hypothetical protein n=1 Tax=Streptomyces sp. NRRL B-24484 TaxID=1463833 RepID=UPI000AD75747|nr:hypothetical protein [Streptomyces sp. NRRL B-24484]
MKRWHRWAVGIWAALMVTGGVLTLALDRAADDPGPRCPEHCSLVVVTGRPR